MADIGKEISAFREAVYGSDVRGSMITLAETLNAEGELVKQEVEAAVQNAEEAVTSANEATASAVLAVEQAKGTIETANEVNERSEGFSKEAKSEAERAKAEADKASVYARIKAPEFFLDTESMVLYMKAGNGLDFKVFHDNELYWKIA